MRNLILATFIGVLLSSFAVGQEMDKYDVFIKAADSLYAAEEYSKSAENYQKAFESNDGKAYPDDRYNAACTFALAGDSEKAYYHLFYLAEHKGIQYKNYGHITTDSDLNSLHKDKRWKKLTALVKNNKEVAEKDYDKPLVAQLDTILQEDQLYRRQIQEIEEEFGRTSEEMENHWDLIQKTDAINLIKVQKILDERGWLGPDVIGEDGNLTLFLVIQHSPSEVQQKYLPMMREAVKKGNAEPSNLALLEDRVALGKGEKQIYGSQVGQDRETGEYYVLPLEDPGNVDQRRAEVGLGPIAEYIGMWGMKWDVQEHIQKMEELDKEKEKE